MDQTLPVEGPVSLTRLILSPTPCLESALGAKFIGAMSYIISVFAVEAFSEDKSQIVSDGALPQSR